MVVPVPIWYVVRYVPWGVYIIYYISPLGTYTIVADRSTIVSRVMSMMLHFFCTNRDKLLFTRVNDINIITLFLNCILSNQGLFGSFQPIDSSKELRSTSKGGKARGKRQLGPLIYRHHTGKATQVHYLPQDSTNWIPRSPSIQSLSIYS